jgi:penicillin amidase/acyl-homoserine-lactone acylase
LPGVAALRFEKALPEENMAIRPHVLFATVFGVIVLPCLSARGGTDAAKEDRAYVPAQGTYTVEILRDRYGVPHIYGKTDADVAYGLGWAVTEDDFKNVSETLLMARGRFSHHTGRKGLIFDLLVRMFQFREIVEREYENQLSSEVRAICQAYADGFNHYAATHPERVPEGLLPCTPVDIVTGFVMRTPFFFGMEREIRKLMGPRRAQEISTPAAHSGGSFSDSRPIGSNTFAVSPRKTPDGKTHLAVNSHQPFDGPVAWYEVHLKSEQGLDITGGTFPGAPVVLHGHNKDLGWAHTVNLPDLCDIYVLEMHPDDPNKYLFDGEYHELERHEAVISMKLWGNLRIPLRREVLKSVHGPVIRRPHGVYAVRFAGYGDIRQVEQWFRMGKSQTIEEFEAALRMRSIPSFNVGYADSNGNIWYLYNALIPIRDHRYDWRAYLPGTTSETLWTEYLPFDALPQVKNPTAGYIQNCNSTPFLTTSGPDNPKPEAYPASMGIEGPEVMTNRAQRANELFGADDSITEEEFYAYKHDWCYSAKSRASRLRDEILASVEDEDPVVQEALNVLRGWNLKADPENTGTAVAVLSMEPVIRAEMFGNPVPDPMESFKERARQLHQAYGRVDVPWKQVNRLVRGDLQLGVGGGPDLLRCIYGDWNGQYLSAIAGDCYVLLVTWDANGEVHSRSIHQYGAATENSDHPHYDDQARLFVNRDLKPTFFKDEELQPNVKVRYRPGDNTWNLLFKGSSDAK